MPFPIAAVLAVAGAVAGAAKVASGNAQERNATEQAQALFKKRKAYQTPEELYKILQATEYDAQSGLGAETLNYLTTQTDRAFDASLNTAELLGGDPNDFSGLFNDKVDAIMRIGTQDNALRMQKFSNYLNAEKMISDSKDAEWLSNDNLLKDQLQAAQGNRAAGAQERANGFNAILGAAANFATSQLYNSDGTAKSGGGSSTAGGSNEDIAGRNGDMSTAKDAISSLNPVLSSTTPQSSLSSGEGYYDTTTHKWRRWDGTEWIRKI